MTFPSGGGGEEDLVYFGEDDLVGDEVLAEEGEELVVRWFGAVESVD